MKRIMSILTDCIWITFFHFFFFFLFFSSSWKGVILSISWVSGSHDVDDHNLVRHNWIILSQSHLIPTKLDSSLSYTMCKTFFFQSSRVATAFRLAPFFPLEKAGNLEVWFPFSASMPYRLGLSFACWLVVFCFFPARQRWVVFRVGGVMGCFELSVLEKNG